MFWMRSSGLADPSGNPATLFDRLSGNGSSSSGDGFAVAQNPNGTVQLQIGSGTSLLTTINSSANTLWATAGTRWRWFMISPAPPPRVFTLTAKRTRTAYPD